MKKDEDPSTLFEQVAAIENSYAALARQSGSSNMIKLADEDVLGVIVDRAPKEYQSVLTTTMIDKGANLTRTDLETVMGKYYRTMSRFNGIKTATGQDKEVSLATTDTKRSSGKREKKCWDCGAKDKIRGHEGCPGKSNSEAGGKCSHCGKDGHSQNDCWKLEKNKDK